MRLIAPLQSFTEIEMSAESVCMLFSAIEGTVIHWKPRRVGQFASVCKGHVYAWWKLKDVTDVCTYPFQNKLLKRTVLWSLDQE